MPDEVTIDGERYVRATNDSPIKIVVLQRGWVLVGRFSQDGEECAVDDASVIRVWGTTKGLGEIAASGPTANTKLDPAGHVRFHVLTTVLTLDCDEASWASRL